MLGSLAIVMTDASLTFHEFEDCLWIRCNGRGCFINSPSLKALADKYLEEGGDHLVVDLELCPGVDSTFMGTLAGIARRCAASGGTLEIASATSRTRAAMESLGLDMLIAIDPAEAAWQADLEVRRAVLAQHAAPENTPRSAETLTEQDRTRHVLEAHQALRSMSEKNDQVFGYVCETLQQDLERHEREQQEQA